MWWADAVFYEIYLQSFQDTNADGIGDFGGVRSRLGYLSDLGIDCLWITPFYPSPGRDNGYDVADYKEVDGRYGSVDEVHLLVDEAHNNGLRVIIDLVPNHTSSDHPWFASALAWHKPYRDYYIWRDPGADGGPPNNWTSHFGGPAWTRDPLSGQYYMHSFLPQQPDLNWRNPAVLAEFEEILTFWLESGVDGFRVDVAPGLIKDASFRDNPPNLLATTGVREYHQTLHVYDQDRPEVHAIYARWRDLADAYDAVLVGEVNLPSTSRVARYVADGGLHVAMYFGLVESAWEPVQVCSRIREAAQTSSRLGWVLSSHDRARAVSRFGGGQQGQRRALLATAATIFLPGPLVLLQGDELGLDDGVVAEDASRDLVFSDPLAQSRDGSRTPMPWDSTRHNGFSTVPPWLPSLQRDDEITVSNQTADPDSPLMKWRFLLRAYRETNPTGTAQFLDTQESVLAFRRGDILLVANLAAEPCAVAAAEAGWQVIFSVGAFELRADDIRLEAESLVVLRSGS